MLEPELAELEAMNQQCSNFVEQNAQLPQNQTTLAFQISLSFIEQLININTRLAAKVELMRRANNLREDSDS